MKPKKIKEQKPKKQRHDARKVPLKDCSMKSYKLRLPAGLYPAANSGALHKAKRAEINDAVVCELEQYLKTGASSCVNYNPVAIGGEWAVTNIIIHVPKPIWAAWKAKGLKYPFSNFLQKFFAEKL